MNSDMLEELSDALHKDAISSAAFNVDTVASRRQALAKDASRELVKLAKSYVYHNMMSGLFLSSDAAMPGKIDGARDHGNDGHFKDIGESIGLYAGIALGAAMRRVKPNHAYSDSMFAHEQAKSIPSTT